MPSLENTRAVIFDVGGTLFDFVERESARRLQMGAADAHQWLTEAGHRLPSVSSYWLRLRWRLARAYSWAWLRRAEMNPMREIAVLHRGMGVVCDDSLSAEIARRYYLPMREIAHAAPGAPETLAELAQRGYKLGIISNTIAPVVGLEGHLEVERLIDHVPMRLYSCEVGVPKPHPRIFLEALQRLDVPAEEAVYVGDKPKIDVRGARRVGMKTVLRCPSGRIPPGPAADFVIAQPPELLDLLPPIAGHSQT